MTLIEVLIALFVFAIGALAVTAMTLMSIQGNFLSNRTVEANLIAQYMMELLLTEPELNNDVSFPPNVNFDFNDYWEIDGCKSGNYTCSFVVTGNGPGESRWLNAEVKWTDAKGDHRVLLRSLWMMIPI